MAIRLTAARANAALDTLVAQLDNGYLRIYDGTRPAGPDTAITSQVLLAELRFANPADASGASGGSASLDAITQDSSANNTGTATWFRALKADGTTAVLDGSVGTSGADLNLVTTSIVATQPVQVSSFALSLPISG